ncbi:hypothetical protein PGT21_023977 [Puccinia graminis f. sp. tritici]|uniref:Uncharacterized protein n=1 Tax=Puccinia graminis f. sp. tritici TaxID=56615 RepID=A0A5B0QPA5_PUCGR|nr:hypothetical protein PGT21_023977 [Puccinia graminis f. sp. tritici]
MACSFPNRVLRRTHHHKSLRGDRSVRHHSFAAAYRSPRCGTVTHNILFQNDHWNLFYEMSCTSSSSITAPSTRQRKRRLDSFGDNYKWITILSVQTWLQNLIEVSVRAERLLLSTYSYVLWP